MHAQELSEIDRRHLLHALELAEGGRAAARPNPLVGAVLARGEEVLATGYHDRFGGPHAERVALDALREVPPEATLYVSLEPCSHWGKQPPCVELIHDRGVGRVVYAGRDPNELGGGGEAKLRAAGIDVLWAGEDFADVAAHQNAGFVSVHTRGRPYVTYKWAMTSNLRVATGDAARRWISSESSREHVQYMRAASGAIAVGVSTVIADDPQLTVRGSAATGVRVPPLRVVYDRSLRLPLESQLVATAESAPVLLMCSLDADAERERRLLDAGVMVWRAPTDDQFLHDSLRELARRGVNDMLLESGPTLATAFFAAGLIDALFCFVSPLRASEEQPGFSPDHPIIEVLRKDRESGDAALAQLGPDMLHEVVLQSPTGSLKLTTSS